MLAQPMICKDILATHVHCGATYASVTLHEAPRHTERTNEMTSHTTVSPPPTLVLPLFVIHSIPEAHDTPRGTSGTRERISWAAKVSSFARLRCGVSSAAPQGPARWRKGGDSVVSNILVAGARLLRGAAKEVASHTTKCRLGVPSD